MEDENEMTATGIPLQGVRGGLVVTRAALGHVVRGGSVMREESPRGWAVTEEPGMSGLVGREFVLIDLRYENNRSGVAGRSLPFRVAFYPDQRPVVYPPKKPTGRSVELCDKKIRNTTP